MSGSNTWGESEERDVVPLKYWVAGAAPDGGGRGGEGVGGGALRE